MLPILVKSYWKQALAALVVLAIVIWLIFRLDPPPTSYVLVARATSWYDVAGLGVDAESGPAAVDGEHGAGDVRRRVRQQGRDDVRHLVRGVPAAERGAGRASSAATSGRSASSASDRSVAIEPSATALHRIPLGA